MHSKEFSGTRENIKISTHPLPCKFGLIFMGMKQIFFFFIEKKFKMADSKKAHFSKSLKNISRKFLRWVLGLVGLNDAEGIDVAQRIWP